MSEISPKEATAGEQATIRLVCTVGGFGASVGGKLRFGVHQHDMILRDWGVPQITDPKAAAYLTVSCSNPKAKLTLRPPALPEGQENPNQLPLHEFVHPRKRFVFDAVVSGDRLRPGDKVTFLYGDRAGGGPGVQAQRGAPGQAYFFLWTDPLGDGVWHEIFVQRIMMHGAAPEGLMAYGPSVAKVGEPFDILVKARDHNYNVAPGYRGTISFAKVEGLELPKPYTFTEQDQGIHVFRGVRATRDGDYVIKVEDRKGGLTTVSNPLSTNFFGPDEKLYWGDPHGHSELCDGDMTADEYYRYARDVSRLDFASLTTHFMLMNQFAWDAMRQAAQEITEPGRFAGIPGWENSGGGIHRLGYYFGDEVPASVPPRQTQAWYDYAVEHPEEKTLITVHYQGQEDLNAPEKGWDRKYDPVRVSIETYSWWRNTFFRTARVPPATMSREYQDLYLAALGRGLHVGAYASGDNHLGQPGAFQGGLTGLVARGLTRGSIYDGFRQHQTYGTTGARVLLRFEINGQKMGDTLESPKDPILDVRLLGTAPFQKVDVYRQGNVVKSLPGEGKAKFRWTGALPKEPGAAESYFFVKAYQEDGQTVWSSPIWVR